jgi:thiol-disulfide isomerase/thioredoxin
MTIVIEVIISGGSSLQINFIMILNPFGPFRAMIRSRGLAQWGVLVLLSILLFSGCAQSGKSLTLEKVTSADILVQVAKHKGKEAVLVNFWATWCAPCVEEFPMIVDLANTWQDMGLKVYFVSVDWLEQVDQARTFLEQQGVTGLSFIKDQKDNPFIDGISEAWTGAVPFTVMYGKRTGKIAEYWEGKAPREKFEAAIRQALSD